MADAGDLKSPVRFGGRAGSTPAPGTSVFQDWQPRILPPAGKWSLPGEVSRMVSSPAMSPTTNLGKAGPPARSSAGTCDYEPFGEFRPGTTCSVPTDFRFAGMQFDSETGLYHTWFRQYDATQGRWLGVDPLPGSPNDPQSLNRYVYVANDPVNLVDPYGLSLCFGLHWYHRVIDAETGAILEENYLGFDPIWCPDEDTPGGGGQDVRKLAEQDRKEALERLDRKLCAGFITAVLNNLWRMGVEQGVLRPDAMPSPESVMKQVNAAVNAMTFVVSTNTHGYSAWTPAGGLNVRLHPQMYPAEPDRPSLLIHESFHTQLFPGQGWTDLALARAANRNLTRRPSESDDSFQRRNSAAFQRELEKYCGPLGSN
jgi:RHS repeat-associated protein